MEATAFARFTDPACFVEIDESVAVELLQVEALLFPETKTAVNLSSLQDRCVEALARDWKSIDVPELELDLCDLNPILFRCTFEKAMASAQRRLWMEQVKVRMGDRKLPSQILVSGAGSEEANGVYAVQSAWCNDGLMFVKQTADENEGNYEICLASKAEETSGNLYWWIHWWTSQAMTEENTNIRWFYEQPMTVTNKFIPLLEGWEKSYDGLLPVPTLTVLWDDDANQET